MCKIFEWIVEKKVNNQIILEKLNNPGISKIISGPLLGIVSLLPECTQLRVIFSIHTVIIHYNRQVPTSIIDLSIMVMLVE